MPEVPINIGGRTFEVACQPGEEQYLQSAARMLDTEASVLVEQIGRVPESRMLLMAGLMLADKTAGLEDRLRESEDRAAGLQDELRALRESPAPAPERIEVPVVPAKVTESMAEIAARAEALADEIEEKSVSRS
ncbi:cell division protein ZapA [Puniceibacterium confluentis]|uniref:cell division protein ZapA n=1 Tax=Puniceibacterium confluentis TaxID=1958944 RepID=UPI0011B644FD|nr:cell division protein ZapA [Puniceibacterium confluentis]